MYQHRGRGIVLAFAVASALLVPMTPAGAQTPADNTKVQYARSGRRGRDR